MPQVTLELEDTVIGRLTDVARARNSTVSKYVASIVSKQLEPKKKKLPVSSARGILKGKVWMSDDFDAPLEEMAGYM